MIDKYNPSQEIREQANDELFRSYIQALNGLMRHHPDLVVSSLDALVRDLTSEVRKAREERNKKV